MTMRITGNSSIDGLISLTIGVICSVIILSPVWVPILVLYCVLFRKG